MVKKIKNQEATARSHFFLLVAMLFSIWSVALPEIFAQKTAELQEDPLGTQFATADIPCFWETFEQAAPGFDSEIFEKLYLATYSPKSFKEGITKK